MGWLLLAVLIGVPILEITLFIQVGGAIGLWPTIAIVILTAVLGTFLIRQQGTAILEQARHRMAQGDPAVRELLHGIGLLAAALMLLTPGFFTDAIGFALLIPYVRSAIGLLILPWILKRANVHSGGPFDGAKGFGTMDEPIIEGEFRNVSDDDGERGPPSGGGKPSPGRTLP